MFSKQIMENTQRREFPCFLSREIDLESVQEEYFNPRLAEEEVVRPLDTFSPNHFFLQIPAQFLFGCAKTGTESYVVNMANET